jgi:hypothetical protein
MKIKNHLHLFPEGTLQNSNIKSEIIDNFIDKTLATKPLGIDLLNRYNDLKFDTIDVSIKILYSKSKKNLYREILKYRLYDIQELILVAPAPTIITREEPKIVETLTPTDALTDDIIVDNISNSPNFPLKFKDNFYNKLIKRNINIDSIVGVYIELHYHLV